MIDEILIEAGLMETRVALLSDQRLQEFHIERASRQSIVGHIYLGRVLKVLPGMQAAFVDIGLGRSAFLAARDARPLLAEQAGKAASDEAPSIFPTIVCEEIESIRIQSLPELQ